MFYLESVTYFRMPYDCCKDPEMIDLPDAQRRVTLAAWGDVPPRNRCVFLECAGSLVNISDWAAS
jgi:hypothetical protein